MANSPNLNEILGSIVDVNAKVATFRGLIYGPKGVGKTTLTIQIMKELLADSPGKFVLHIDTSEGYVSLRNVPGLQDGVKTMPFTTYENLRAIADAIKKKIKPFDQIGGIVLDEMSKMAEQDTLRVFEARKTGAYGAKEQDMADDQVTTEGRDHQIALNRFRKMYYDVFDLRDIHVIATAHQAEKKDKQGNIIAIAPDFSPKIGGQAGQLVHLVAYITAKTVKNPEDLKVTNYERMAQVHPTTRIDAKTRLDIKTTSVNAALLPKIVSKWAEHGVEIEHTEIRPAEENSIFAD